MDESQPLSSTSDDDNAPVLTRQQARRLRDIHRSAGWPAQDGLEIELLASGMLHRVPEPGGAERLRLTDRGIQCLAQALQRNRQALSAHDALVARVAQALLREGRIVWTGLAVRARLPSDAAAAPVHAAVAQHDFALHGEPPSAAPARWKICKPDVFSIRNTTVAAYLQPVVHEIKVSRADLLGDLRLNDKRDSYLDLGGQCWYVLGCDARGRPIAQAHEVPASCGVMLARPEGPLEVLRHAPRRVVPDLPFALWMSLARATPQPAASPAWLYCAASPVVLPAASQPKLKTASAATASSTGFVSSLGARRSATTNPARRCSMRRRRTAHDAGPCRRGGIRLR